MKESEHGVGCKVVDDFLIRMKGHITAGWNKAHELGYAHDDDGLS